MIRGTWPDAARTAAFLTLSFGALPASAVVPTPATPNPVPSASGANAARANAEHRFCTESLPEGRKRPNLTEKVPDKIASGYALELEVTIEHEAREVVMPGGSEFQLQSDDTTELARLGFVLPSPKGPSKMRVEAAPQANPPKTKVTLPLLVLPKEPGRATLTLPSLPVTIARANGEVFTVCTTPHDIVVEDPTASTPDAKPKGNPPGRRQLEEWTSLKQAVQVGSIALVVGALLATLFLLWKRRPKRLPPPPPPRAPWEVAFEELARLRAEDLIRGQRFAEHYDRVSDTVRKYLGARYGFDGLETTTKEMLTYLRSARLEVGTLANVELFLHDADLVKFAKRTPTEAECVIVLDQAEGFVRATRPMDEVANGAPRRDPDAGGEA
jgi:hypothetical protein